MRKFYSKLHYLVAQIKSFEVDPATMGATLHFYNDAPSIQVNADFMFRNNPRPLDYYVKCEKGYDRIVNADVFHQQYMPVDLE